MASISRAAGRFTQRVRDKELRNRTLDVNGESQESGEEMAQGPTYSYRR